MKRMIVIALLAVMLLDVSGVAEYQTLRPGARGKPWCSCSRR